MGVGKVFVPLRYCSFFFARGSSESREGKHGNMRSCNGISGLPGLSGGVYIWWCWGMVSPGAGEGGRTKLFLRSGFPCGAGMVPAPFVPRSSGASFGRNLRAFPGSGRGQVVAILARPLALFFAPVVAVAPGLLL